MQVPIPKKTIKLRRYDSFPILFQSPSRGFGILLVNLKPIYRPIEALLDRQRDTNLVFHNANNPAVAQNSVRGHEG